MYLIVLFVCLFTVIYFTHFDDFIVSSRLEKCRSCGFIDLFSDINSLLLGQDTVNMARNC